MRWCRTCWTVFFSGDILSFVKLLSIAVVAFSLFASQALAQDGANVTSYDFEDDLVTGDLVRPDGELLGGRPRGKRTSLIRIREHFVPEMLKSVEDL